MHPKAVSNSNRIPEHHRDLLFIFEVRFKYGNTKCRNSILLITLFTITVGRNQDWANVNYYKEANLKLSETGKLPKNCVVWMGDSITENWNRSDPYFFNENNINRGISGQTTSQMLLRFRNDVIHLKPKLVIILAGTNDIAENTGPITLPEIFGNILSMTELAQANQIKVVLCSILPALKYSWKPAIEPAEKIVTLNQMIKNYADQNNLTYIDFHAAMGDSNNGLKKEFADDGVHPNKSGYDLMKPIAEQAINPILKS